MDKDFIEEKKKKLKVPDGYLEILQDLSYNVIKKQPENVLKFCLDYFIQNSGYDPRINNKKDLEQSEISSFSTTLFNPIVENINENIYSKITIVGSGAVGMATAFALLIKNLTNELIIIDANETKAKGEIMDLEQGQLFFNDCKIFGGSDFKLSANSDIVIITAGARQALNESRLNLISKNVEIFKLIIKEIVKYSPNTILLIVSNPVDIMTYIAWKLSGFPSHRVIGSGTALDSARFRFYLGKKLNIAPESIHCMIIGEHGDSSIALWSKISVSGGKLSKLNPNIGKENDLEHFNKIHKDVINAANDIIAKKGYTSWSIAVCLYSICDAILNNKRKLITLSAPIKGYQKLDLDIYSSVPCIVSGIGLSSIVNVKLNDQEFEKFAKGAEMLDSLIKEITLTTS